MKKVSDEKLLEALIINGGASGAAAALGISRNAVYKRLGNDDFRQQYEALQTVLLSTAATTMSDALDDAVNCLREMVNDDYANPNTRVSAADSLLRHCARYVELSSIESRLTAVESAMREREKNENV